MLKSECDARLTLSQYLKGNFVNIEDFVEAREKGEKARIYATASALREYTIATQKIFPLYKAKANPFLCWMLIHIRFGGV